MHRFKTLSPKKKILFLLSLAIVIVSLSYFVGWCFCGSLSCCRYEEEDAETSFLKNLQTMDLHEQVKNSHNIIKGHYEKLMGSDFCEKISMYVLPKLSQDSSIDYDPVKHETRRIIDHTELEKTTVGKIKSFVIVCKNNTITCLIRTLTLPIFPVEIYELFKVKDRYDSNNKNAWQADEKSVTNNSDSYHIAETDWKQGRQCAVLMCLAHFFCFEYFSKCCCSCFKKDSSSSSNTFISCLVNSLISSVFCGGGFTFSRASYRENGAVWCNQGKVTLGNGDRKDDSCLQCINIIEDLY